MNLGNMNWTLWTLRKLSDVEDMSCTLPLQWPYIRRLQDCGKESESFLNFSRMDSKWKCDVDERRNKQREGREEGGRVRRKRGA